MRKEKLSDGHEYEVMEDSIIGVAGSFRLVDLGHDYKILRRLPDPNPMPELEIGDWVFSYAYPQPRALRVEYDLEEYNIPRVKSVIFEIRKPSGLVWKRDKA